MKIDKGKVVEVIADEFGVEEYEVTDDADFVKDLDSDSLDLTELAIALEEVFDVEIADDDIARLTSLKAVMQFLAEVPDGRR